MEGPPQIIAIPLPPKPTGIVHGGQQAYEQKVNIQVAFPPVDANICCNRHPARQATMYRKTPLSEPSSSPSQTE
jgi:hypothetical protein